MLTPALWLVWAAQNLMRSAVVELGDRRREAVACAGEIRPIEHRLAGHVERFHHAAGVVERPGKFHRLGGQVRAEPELAADEVPLPDAHDDRDELRRLPDPLAQLARPAEDRADFRRGITARREVGGAQRDSSSSNSRASRSGDSSSASSSASPRVRWPIASISADRSRERSPALSQ